jgi:hypothetical protein
VNVDEFKIDRRLIERLMSRTLHTFLFLDTDKYQHPKPKEQRSALDVPVRESKHCLLQPSSLVRPSANGMRRTLTRTIDRQRYVGEFKCNIRQWNIYDDKRQK